MKEHEAALARFDAERTKEALEALYKAGLAAQSDAEPDIDRDGITDTDKDPPPPWPQSDVEPDPTKVICPNCAHQFGAISVVDQARLAQPDAEPKRK